MTRVSRTVPTVALAALLAALLLAAAGATGCMERRYKAPEVPPSIHGEVQFVAPPCEEGCVLAMRVEGEPPVDEPYVCAEISLPRDAPVLVGVPEAVEFAGPAAIHDGDEVIVWFDDVPSFSCPVEGDAAMVLVIERG